MWAEALSPSQDAYVKGSRRPAFGPRRRGAEKLYIRLAGALLIEQDDEWLVSRRDLSEESLALVLIDADQFEEVTAELGAAA